MLASWTASRQRTKELRPHAHTALRADASAKHPLSVMPWHPRAQKRPVRRPGPPANAASFVPSQFRVQSPAKSSWETVWTTECAVWTRIVLLPGLVAAQRLPTADSLTRALGYQKSIESRCKVEQMTPTPLKWHLLGPVLPATNELHGEHDCSRTIEPLWGGFDQPTVQLQSTW